MADEPDLKGIKFLGAERARRAESVDDCRHEDMLLRVIDELGETKPDHVIVMVGNLNEDGSVNGQFYQSGKFNHFEILGMLKYVGKLIEDEA